MTIKDLRDHLSNLDDSCMITLQKSDGTEMDIAGASEQGDHLILWTDSPR